MTPAWTSSSGSSRSSRWCGPSSPRRCATGWWPTWVAAAAGDGGSAYGHRRARLVDDAPTRAPRGLDGRRRRAPRGGPRRRARSREPAARTRRRRAGPALPRRVRRAARVRAPPCAIHGIGHPRVVRRRRNVADRDPARARRAWIRARTTSTTGAGSARYEATGRRVGRRAASPTGAGSHRSRSAPSSPGSEPRSARKGAPSSSRRAASSAELARGRRSSPAGQPTTFDVSDTGMRRCGWTGSSHLILRLEAGRGRRDGSREPASR